ncbi:MAG: YfhO family protein [Candidatus Daviesbacteria bacterium]|nr:YfhO family protein [Candidatus Daviesbacteria bacterium]
MFKLWLNKIWPYLVILTVVLSFFYPVFKDNKVPIPADNIVGIYYPWLDYKWPGFPYGVPVKNPIASDVVSFTFPMQTLGIDLIKTGQLPLWNPFILAGTPLMANFQSATFSIVNVVYLFLPKIDAWTLQIILQPILGATFLFLLLKYLKRSTIASVIGALIYPFSGFMMIWLEWNGHSLVAAFFPLVILLTLKLLDTQKILYGVLLSVVLALQIFSGYPQIIIYEYIAIFLMLIFVERKSLWSGKIVLLILSFSLGIGMAAIQIIPGFELVNQSQRETEVIENDWALLGSHSVITFIAPDYFGNHTTYNYWGPADYNQATGFSGAVAIALATLGILTSRKERGVKYGVLFIALALINAFDNPLSRAIHQSSFLSSQAAIPHRILVLSNLGIAILAGFGLDVLLSKGGKILDLIKALSFPLLILCIYSFVSLVIFFYPALYPDQTVEINTVKSNMLIGLRNLSFTLTILFATAILFMFSHKFNRYKKISVILIGLLVVVELFRFGWKFTPFSPKQIIFPSTPVLDFLQKQTPPFRVSANEVIPINLMMPYKIETVEGYDAVYSLRFSKFISAVNLSNKPMGRYGLVENTTSKLLNLVNMKYVLALKREEDGTISQLGSINKKYQNNNFKKVFEDSSVVVLENTAALPRVSMFYQWEVGQDDKTLEVLASNFPLDQKLILTEQPGIESKPGKSMVDLSNYTNSNRIKVTTDQPGLLFIANSWYPGWKALVDGKVEQIIRVDYTFMAVPISSGQHTVTLEYKPNSFEIGKEISLFSFLVTMIFLLFGLRKSKI